MPGPDSTDLPGPVWSFFQPEPGCQWQYIERSVTQKFMVYVPLSHLQQNWWWGGPQSYMLCELWVRRWQECSPPQLVSLCVCGWMGESFKPVWMIKDILHIISSVLHLAVTGVTGWDFSRNRNRKYSCLHVLSRTNNWYGFYTHILLPYLDNHHGSYKGVCVCVCD